MCAAAVRSLGPTWSMAMELDPRQYVTNPKLNYYYAKRRTTKNPSYEARNRAVYMSSSITQVLPQRLFPSNELHCRNTLQTSRASGRWRGSAPIMRLRMP